MANKKDNPSPHALDDLVARVGKNNPKLLSSILKGTTNEALVEAGATIATVRLVTDGGRLYGEAFAFWDSASDEQKKCLRGFSPALLGVAVHHLDALRKLESGATQQSHENATQRAAADESAREAATKAIAIRDQAYDAMRDTAGDQARRKQVDKAVGTADTAAKLALGLDALAKLLTLWMASKDEDLKARLELAQLDKSFVGELERAASDVRGAAAAAAKRTSTKASQAALDREDGVQILLLGQIIRAFDAAHERDHTIPRLVPISTRRLFGRIRKKAAPEAGEGGESGESADQPG